MLFSGEPPGLSSQKLSAASAKAHKVVSSVTRRHTSNFGRGTGTLSVADPDLEEDEVTTSDVSKELQIWRLLPQLRSLPESLVSRLPLATMFVKQRSTEGEEEHY